jgi:hypothetical protein
MQATGLWYTANPTQRLAEADMGRTKQHYFNTSDESPVDELLCELRVIPLSYRCLVNRDHETEWNNRVRTMMLQLA